MVVCIQKKTIHRIILKSEVFLIIFATFTNQNIGYVTKAGFRFVHIHMKTYENLLAAMWLEITNTHM